MYDCLEKLMKIHAPSGREHKLAAYLKDLMAPYADTVYIDRVGNVVARIDGCGEKKKKVLYSAHMDEVAEMVVFIEQSGYIRVTNLGGPNTLSLAYREVEFDSGLHGYVVPNANATTDLNAMYVDIGTHSREETEKYVHVGDTLAAVNTLCHLTGTVVAGRPIDNRIGIAVLVKAAMDIKASGKKPYNDVVFAFSVQEEVDPLPLGATVIAHEEQPDVGIAVDVCGVGDVPGITPQVMKVGGGAAIMIRDSRLISDKWLVDALTKTAVDKKIPYQYEVSLAGGQDAVALQKIDNGSRAACVSIPMRYLHTSAETADLQDAEACKDLVVSFCNVIIPDNN